MQPLSGVRFQSPQLPPAADIERYFELSREERWFSNEGPCHRLLCERLPEYLDAPARFVPVANGTLGLVLALRAVTEARAGEGTEVLLPSFTYVAVVSAILWAGLEPVFVDVDATHWHVSPESLGHALDQRGSSVAAVLACTAFGTPPPVAAADAWESLAREAGVPLVVDSAAGFGARDEEGTPLGLRGDAEVFSFHATKPFAVGEGGAVSTRREDIAERIRELSAFGLDRARTLPGAPGLNAKMSEWHSATALAVLDRYDAVLEARRKRAAAIAERLRPCGFQFQAGAGASTWQFVPVLAPSPTVRRDVLQRGLREGVELRTYYEPLHRMPPLSHLIRAGDLEVTHDLTARILSLPMANDLPDEHVDLVCRLGEREVLSSSR